MKASILFWKLTPLNPPMKLDEKFSFLVKKIIMKHKKIKLEKNGMIINQAGFEI